MNTAIQTVRAICSDCTNRTKTGFSHNGCEFEARRLTKMESVGARFGLLAGSQVLAANAAVLAADGLDGMEWIFRELQGGKTGSRATGGLSKFECGIDPTFFKTKRHRKVLNTERIYIHREECNLEFIGSIHQGASQAGVPVYFNGSASLQQVKRNTDFFMDLLMYDAHTMARQIDGNLILGNWAGDNRGEMFKDSAGTVSVQANVFPHFDGWVKQTLQQGDAAYYATVTVELPKLVDGECYWVSFCGQGVLNYESAEALVIAINTVCTDIDGKFPFVASLDGTTVTIIATEAEKEAYGQDAIQLYIGESIDSCQEALTANVIQCPMEWSQMPLLFDHNETVNCSNWREYWVRKIKDITKRCVELDQSGESFSLTNYVILYDPLIDVEGQFADFYECGKCENDATQRSFADRMLGGVRFVPIKAMQGTGIWFGSFSNNLIALTNNTNDTRGLGAIETGYDGKCGTIWQKMDILLNGIVVDFNKVATNAFNSPFSNKLTAPYEPENLPHYNGELRSDAAVNCGCALDTSDFIPTACITLSKNVDGSGTLNLKDTSTIPTDCDVDVRTWEVFVTPTGEVTVPATDEEVDVSLTAPECASLGYVKLTIKCTDGREESNIIPFTDFIQQF